MARAINKCPSCGSNVSQFAAGCAVCGFDLEAARAEAAERGPSIADRASDLRPRLGAGVSRDTVFLIALIALLVVFFPIVGLALAGWSAYDRNRDGDLLARNAALVLIAVAVVFLAVPDLRFGIVGALT